MIPLCIVGVVALIMGALAVFVLAVVIREFEQFEG